MNYNVFQGLGINLCVLIFSFFSEKTFLFGTKQEAIRLLSNRDCLPHVHQWSTFPCKPFSRAVFTLAKIPLVAWCYRIWNHSQSHIDWSDGSGCALCLLTSNSFWEETRVLEEPTPCLSVVHLFAVVTTANKDVAVKINVAQVCLSCVQGC